MAIVKTQIVHDVAFGSANSKAIALSSTCTALVVAITNNTDGVDPSSVTYNGVSMTKSVVGAQSLSGTSFWTLGSPSTGASHNMVMNFSGNKSTGFTIWELAGTQVTGFVGTTARLSGGSTSIGTAITTTGANSLVLTAAGTYGTTMTTASGETQEFGAVDPSNNGYLASADKYTTTAGSYSYLYVYSTSGGQSGMAVLEILDQPLRYWVGGTGTWNTTPGTKWSLTSGGSGGAAVPTLNDNVFFDSNSGSGTITMGIGLTNVKSFTTTGFTGTITDAGSGKTLEVYGDFLLGSSTSLTVDGIIFNNPCTINTNGVTVNTNAMQVDITGTATLLGDLNLTGEFQVALGTFNANNHNITAKSVFSSYTNARGITMGSGTWTLTGTGTIWNFTTTTNLSFNAGTSTIRATNTAGTSKVFEGGSLTYYNLWNDTGPSSSGLFVDGSNTFNNLKITPGSHHIPQAGSTTILSTIDAVGTSGNHIFIQTSATAATFSIASGTISCDYLELLNNQATGGATFYAGSHSVDGGGNTGWIFTSVPGASSNFFLSLL